MTCPKLLTVNRSLFYANDTCAVFQHKNIPEIEKSLLKDFSGLCD